MEESYSKLSVVIQFCGNFSSTNMQTYKSVAVVTIPPLKNTTKNKAEACNITKKCALILIILTLILINQIISTSKPFIV